MRTRKAGQRSTKPVPPVDHRRTRLRVLVVDKGAADRLPLVEALRGTGKPAFEISEAGTLEGALHDLATGSIHVCIVSSRLAGGATALDLFRATRHRGLEIPFIAIASTAEEQGASGTLLLEGFDEVLSRKEVPQAPVDRIVRNAWLRSVHLRNVVENASTDVLTGALNRRGIVQRLQIELRKVRRVLQPLSLVCLDVKGFQAINDQWGHLVGDQCLRHLTEVCKRELRETDAFGRMGGGEFVAILPGVAPRSAAAMVRHFTAALERTPLRHVKGTLEMPVTTGFTTVKPDSEPMTVDELLEAAEREMLLHKDTTPTVS